MVAQLDVPANASSKVHHPGLFAGGVEFHGVGHRGTRWSKHIEKQETINSTKRLLFGWFWTLLEPFMFKRLLGGESLIRIVRKQLTKQVVS